MYEVCRAACHHERMLAEVSSFRRQAERCFRLALTGGSGDADNAEPVGLALLDWTGERVAPILATSGAMTPVR